MEELAIHADQYEQKQVTLLTGGNVMTVFSAPDYPQFQTSDQRYDNLGALLRLREPDYATPEPLQFAAQLPRPPVCAFSSTAWGSACLRLIMPVCTFCFSCYEPLLS